ncbi:site-2 protease family protein [Oceanobacillus massiliensis]|uniref:site-2 protease family protein n=1 Tax=Oceanobacillus massiliensis TaxID=1465765 RepID=UPI00028A1DFD|nr:site-2 protease family protein [Oceanobacillus massiliensis]
MDMYLLACLLFVIAPLSTLIHELGHVSGAFSVRADFIHLSVGIGRQSRIITFKNLQIILHPVYFLSGFTRSGRKDPYSKSEAVRIAVMGPLFNGATALFIFIINEFVPSSFLQLFFWFNIWMTIGNMVPFRIGGKETDGFAIIKAVRIHRQNSAK